MIGFFLARPSDFRPQSFAVAGCVTRARRTVQTLLAKRKIVAQNLNAAGTECVREGDQQWRIPIRSGPVSEN
jgi:hypothetical protein